jgi:tRNA (cytidine32/uridine32-2'-O)-methyltransferase
MKLENIRIVMIGTTHPGNVGAAARAMHNMCISRLTLVDPQCPIGDVAYGRASGANVILDNRETHADLGAAIADCSRVIATTARRRSLPWPELDPREMAESLFALDDNRQVALVFGRENSGLSNDELQMCQQMVCIPTNAEFSSLNVASAIQVMCYELFRYQAEPYELPAPDGPDLPASSAEVEGYIEHLRQTLDGCGFLNPQQPEMIMQRLRRIYMRNELTRSEIHILRGILSSFARQQG